MAPSINDIRDYLADLDYASLVEARQVIEELLETSKANGNVEDSKRPHMAMRERRISDRYSIELHGRCWEALLTDPSEADKHDVRIVDISHNGCGLIADTRFQPSQVLALEFRPPSGVDQRILVEVMRVAEIEHLGKITYDHGCRSIDRESIDQAQKDRSLQNDLRERLDDHAGIRIVQVASGEGSRTVQNMLRDYGYNLKTISKPLHLLEEIKGHAAHLLIVPSTVLLPEKPDWYAQFRHEFPEVAILAVSTSHDDAIPLHDLHLEEILHVDRIETDLVPALERALYTKLVWHDRKLARYPVKVLITGPEEKHRKCLETLLLEEDYLIAKTDSAATFYAEFERQRFDILVAAEEFFSENDFQGFQALHRDNPLLVIICEGDNPERVKRSLARGADFTLPRPVNRSTLLERLAAAYRLLLVRKYSV
jgi:hypothetical protein